MANEFVEIFDKKSAVKHTKTELDSWKTLCSITAVPLFTPCSACGGQCVLKKNETRRYAKDGIARQCNACRKWTSARKGTILEGSDLTAEEYVYAILAFSKKLIANTIFSN